MSGRGHRGPGRRCTAADCPTPTWKTSMAYAERSPPGPSPTALATSRSATASPSPTLRCGRAARHLKPSERCACSSGGGPARPERTGSWPCSTLDARAGSSRGPQQRSTGWSYRAGCHRSSSMTPSDGSSAGSTASGRRSGWSPRPMVGGSTSGTSTRRSTAARMPSPGGCCSLRTVRSGCVRAVSAWCDGRPRRSRRVSCWCSPDGAQRSSGPIDAASAPSSPVPAAGSP